MKRLSTFAPSLLLLVSCASSTLVESNPQGASVFVDGEEKGVTPLSLHLSSFAWNQSYEIRLVLEGYETAIEQVKREQKGFLGMGGTDWPARVFREAQA